MDEHYETIDNAPTNIKPHIKSNFIKFKKLYNEGDKELIESIRKELWRTSNARVKTYGVL